MLRFIVFRLFYIAIVMVVVSMLIFGLSRLVGDPRNYYLDEYATQEQYEAWGKAMGLDRPLVVQYAIWASKAVRGEFGMSLRHRREALDVVAETVPATLQLTGVGFLVVILIGIPLGVLSAVKRGTYLDYAGRTFALFSQALPAFWIGIMMILLFAVTLDWLPTGGRGDWKHYILPAISLGSGPFGRTIAAGSIFNALRPGLRVHQTSPRQGGVRKEDHLEARLQERNDSSADICRSHPGRICHGNGSQ